jgi:hypothetical protein
MAISGISLTSAAGFQNPNDPRLQFNQLAKAVNSGNLTGAQQAFAQLSQALGDSSGGSNNAGTSNDPVAQALATIGQALQSGDIGSAQQALASLQQQTQGARGHHHHHGGQRHDAGANGSATGNGAATTSSLSPATTGTNVDVTA